MTSSLGQPLKAEIEIVALQAGEADTLSAALASQDTFRQANVELNSAVYDVRFAIERRQNQHVLVLSSVRPINEPFLDLLVQLNWAGGRLVREYTFLLDPPEFKGSAVASPAIPVTPPVAQAIAPETPAPVAPAAPAARIEPSVPASTPAETYEVKRGDTLGKIARQAAPQGVTLQQMLVALYRSNEDAFIGSNMNRLRAGRILNIPDRDAVLAIDPEDARRMVNKQSSAYAEYQRSVGAAVAAAPAPPEAGRQASGRITPLEPEKPAGAKEAPRDQVRLSKPDDAKAGGQAARVASGDDAVAREKALKEAQERVAALEKNVADLQKLLVLKSAPGAQMQQQAAEASKAPAPAPKVEPAKAPPAAPKEDTSKAPGAKAEPPSQTGKAAPAEAAKAPAPEAGKAPAPEAGKAPAPEAGKAPAPAPEAGKAPDVGKAAPKAPVKTAPPPPEPSLIDEMLDNPYALGGIGAVIVLLAGYGVYAWRRKKQTAEQRFSSSVLGPASSAVPSSVLGTAGGQSVDTGTSSMHMDFSTGTPAKGETEEIDPIAEADVYMAYGRDAQAEEILKESLTKDPARHGVRLKLLEIYANRRDAKTFESVARELHSATSGQGPDWDKAVALGQQVDPSNPLYGGSGETAPSATATAPSATAPAAEVAAEAPTVEVATAPPLDFDLDVGVAAASTEPDIKLDAATPAAEQPVTIDFDLDLGSEKSEPASAAQASAEETLVVPAKEAAPAVLDFDLGLSSQPAAVPAPEPALAVGAAKPAAASEAAASIDFDFDLKLPEPALAPAGEPALAATAAPDIDLSAISLDLNTEPAALSAPTDAKWQEVATKLDLAKAYEEMGDKDGARDLLNEVVREGDTTQQEQAKTLLAEMQ